MNSRSFFTKLYGEPGMPIRLRDSRLLAKDGSTEPIRDVYLFVGRSHYVVYSFGSVWPSEYIPRGSRISGFFIGGIRVESLVGSRYIIEGYAGNEVYTVKGVSFVRKKTDIAVGQPALIYVGFVACDYVKKPY